MTPTLRAGERIWVEKWTLGARIYKKYDFSSSVLSCFRMPGIGHLSPGDIAVFNSPDGGNPGSIGFKINYVYAKRCIGTPGDTVRIVKGFYYNSSLPGRLLCPAEAQARLSFLSSEEADSVRMYRKSIKNVPWSARDFGPMVIPAKGCTMTFDSLTAAAYAMAVEYETGRRPVVGETYTFRGDWFFFGGDYVLNSRDSRYFGLIPSEYIIGKVLPLGHKNRTAKGLQKKDSALEEALTFALTNRGELEKVLYHYSGDERKENAAKWLIRNMPYHYSYAPSAQVDSVKALLSDIQNGKSVEKGLKQSSLRVLERDLTKVFDSRVITAEYLIDNIDLAFAVYDKRSWNRDLSFNEFCELILPYRVGEEPLENWLEMYLSRYGYVLDSLYTGGDVIVACDSINKALKHYFRLEVDLQSPDLGPCFLLETRVGGCKEISGFSQYLLRALGVPSATDFIKKGMIHSWTTVRDTTGKMEYLRLFAESGRAFQERGQVDYRSKGKVYRKTFTQSNGQLYRDVSSEYFGEFSCTIPFNRRMTKMIWLGMFVRGQWFPLEKGGTHWGKVTFSSFEPNMVYAPVDSRGKEAGYPFIRFEDGSVKILLPGEHSDSINIRRKTRLKNRIANYMAESAGCIMEGSLKADFSSVVWRDTLSMPTGNYNRIHPRTSMRYLRLRVPSDKPLQMAEIRLFNDSKRQTPIRMSIYSSSLGKDKDVLATNLVDGDELTYFHSEEIAPFVILDIGKEAYVDFIEWTPRNDDNFIRFGDEYELLYNDGPAGWMGLGRKVAQDTVLSWSLVPKNALLRLHNYTRGREEDTFINWDGEQLFVSWDTL